MPSSQSQLTSTMLKDKQPRMLVPSQALKYLESSTNPPQLLLPTVWTRSKVKRMLSFSILVVVLLMFHFLLSTAVSLKLSLLQVIPILVVKISIRESPTTSAKFSRKSTMLTLRQMFAPLRNLCLKLKKQRETSLQFFRLRLPSKV